MYRVLARYEISPESMDARLSQLPGFIAAIDSVETDMILENMWVSKNRTQFFFVRSTESVEADHHAVDEVRQSEWLAAHGHLMDNQIHTSYVLESIFPPLAG